MACRSAASSIISTRARSRRRSGNARRSNRPFYSSPPAKHLLWTQFPRQLALSLGNAALFSRQRRTRDVKRLTRPPQERLDTAWTGKKEAMALVRLTDTIIRRLEPPAKGN